MPQVNPDPHDEGYVYQPTHAVTGDFPAGVDVQAVQRALTDAGFGPEQVQVFEGEAGGPARLQGGAARRLGQFRRALEQLFADETTIFDRAEEVLRSGGVMVAAFTGGDAALRDRAVEVLKSHSGQEVVYWGEWTIHRL